MTYVRGGLIKESGVAADEQQRLLASTYEEPRGLVPAFPYVRGHLRLVDPQQPPTGIDGAAIELEWSGEPPKATRTDSGDVELSFTENVTLTKLPPNTTLELFGAGMRAAYMKIAEGKPFEVKVKRAGAKEWTDVPPARAEAGDPTETTTES